MPKVRAKRKPRKISEEERRRRIFESLRKKFPDVYAELDKILMHRFYMEFVSLITKGDPQ